MKYLSFSQDITIQFRRYSPSSDWYSTNQPTKTFKVYYRPQIGISDASYRKNNSSGDSVSKNQTLSNDSSLTGIYVSWSYDTTQAKAGYVQGYRIRLYNNAGDIVKTYYTTSHKKVWELIKQEVENGRQAYIVYPLIDESETLSAKAATIEAQKLQENVFPQYKIGLLHGKLKPNEKDEVMNDFKEGKFDILVSTTVVEVGVDNPNATVIVIENAERFGLAQLYQIRGRIGRSERVGYAYLMYDEKKVLSEDAIKRLSTIKEFTDLGSGFQIAMRDLSIRGAGDILGSEQSGYIDSIGIDLYLKMLKEEVDKLKGEYVERKDDSNRAVVEVETHISDDYVSESDLKIDIHKKINDIDSYDKLVLVKEELEDRFGKISKELEIYMYEEWLEKLANKLEIKNKKQTKTMIEFEISEKMSKRINGEKLFYTAYDISKNFKLKSVDNKIHIIFDIVNLEKHFVMYLIDLFSKIIEENNI